MGSTRVQAAAVLEERRSVTSTQAHCRAQQPRQREADPFENRWKLQFIDHICKIIRYLRWKHNMFHLIKIAFFSIFLIHEQKDCVGFVVQASNVN